MKEIKDKNETVYNRRITQGRRITFTTDDLTRYVFWDLPWYDYPIFSHREHKTQSGSKVSMDETGGLIHTDSGNYTLPTAIREALFEKYGGFYKAEGEVKFIEEQRQKRTILKAEVGDMYPLRTPGDDDE